MCNVAAIVLYAAYCRSEGRVSRRRAAGSVQIIVRFLCDVRFDSGSSGVIITGLLIGISSDYSRRNVRNLCIIDSYSHFIPDIGDHSDFNGHFVLNLLARDIICNPATILPLCRAALCRVGSVCGSMRSHRVCVPSTFISASSGLEDAVSMDGSAHSNAVLHRVHCLHH